MRLITLVSMKSASSQATRLSQLRYAVGLIALVIDVRIFH